MKVVEEALDVEEEESPDMASFDAGLD